jgi:AAHS family 4-hydroxybenzoate transporter-like MFS transporter
MNRSRSGDSYGFRITIRAIQPEKNFTFTAIWDMDKTDKTRNYSKIRIQELIGEGPMSFFQVFVVLMCFILNMNDGIDVLVVSYTASEILTEWGLTKAQQGYIFSAGLAGMTLGCLFIAPIADRIGRRRLFIFAVGLESLAMIASYLVSSYGQLLVLRFLAGLGIGGLLPTMAAVASEFSNNHRKDLSVGFVQAGWPIGAILMGFFTAWAVPELGWRFAYLAAGLISGVMWFMVVLFMPESIEYLLKKQPDRALERINKVLSKLGRNELDTLPQAPETVPPNVRTLFGDHYRGATIRLWIGIFFGFMTLYTLISWVPSIAKEAGMPFQMATYAGVLLNIGAFIGSTGIGWLAARFRLKRLIFIFFLVAFGIMVLYGSITLTNALIFILTFLMGIFVQGGFNGYWPATTRIYDTEVRTTGVGWAVGAGRFGAILGPALFGILSDLNLSVAVLFVIFSVPLVISSVAVIGIPSRNLQ